MLDHVIIFRADGLEPYEEEELMAELMRLGEVPGIIDFAMGKNFGARSRGFDYCVRATFENRQALEDYERHPLHMEVVAYNRKITTEHICVDFEWANSGS